jgi:hypothetical protein
MTDLSFIQYGAMALVATGWIAILAFVGLRAWNGWLALKRTELELMAAGARGASEPGMAGAGAVSAATRIDVADLKERIRKLEAIAAGVEL